MNMVVIAQRGIVKPTDQTFGLGIYLMECKFRDEGTQIRVYVSDSANAWRGPYLLEQGSVMIGMTTDGLKTRLEIMERK